MTLDEAIKHCKEKAEELKKEAGYLDAPYGMDTSARTDCLECAKEHEQLAEWLTELKKRREAIKNGKPYGDSGDLISREALKGVIETYRPALIYNNKTDMKNRMVDYFLDEIDNAQAVDLWQMRQEATENALKNAEVLYARPKGEWIDRMLDKGYVECPFCHKQITGGDLNFCVKCGADMRKGGVE